MQSTILTEENLITKLVLITSKLLNLNIKYQVKKVEAINYDNFNNANVKFVQMMNIKL